MSSNFTVSGLVQDARAYAELIPVLGESGFTQQPALQFANTVMQCFLAQSLDWRFNRGYVPPILTVGLQQDYVTQVTNLSWLEQGWRIDINNSTNNGNQGPKPIFSLETVRDLAQTSYQANPFQLSWLPNNLAVMGTWYANTSFPCAYGQQQTPTSPIQQFIDANGNILFIDSTVLNINLQSPGFTSSVIIPPGPYPYGITGSVQPILPPNSYANITGSSLTANVATINAVNNFTNGATFSIKGSTNGGGIFNVYNTTITTATASSFSFALNHANVLQANDTGTAGLTVTDGTVVWTVANPNGIAIRAVPLPALNGLCWLIQPVYQLKPPVLTSLQNTLSPIPDELVYMFREGFLALCFEHANSKQFAGKFLEWKESITTALRSGDRERESDVFFPSQGIMGGGPWNLGLPIGAANPYGTGYGY